MTNIDDDLLRDIGQELSRWFFYGNNVADRISELLSSGPMQRLRAAWTAELLEASGRVTTRLESELATAARERDEARQQRSTPNRRLNEARNERDEARADFSVDRQKDVTP